MSCAHQADEPRHQTFTVSENLRVESLLPGIWLHTSWRTLSSGARFPANGLLVRNRNELIMVDTAWGADATEELMQWIDRELRLPVSAAVVTHFHEDSMGGAGVLQKRSIPVWAHPFTLAQSGSSGLLTPLTAFTKSNTVQFRNLEIFYPGAGHSIDNVVVWVPASTALFGSCAVRSPEFDGRGNTADADIANWPHAIQNVKQRYPEATLVIPGHGTPGTTALLTHTIGLFEKR